MSLGLFLDVADMKDLLEAAIFIGVPIRIQQYIQLTNPTLLSTCMSIMKVDESAMGEHISEYDKGDRK